MPRPKTTPANARRTLDAHIGAAQTALATLAASNNETEHVAAARVLEAAGCYARRAAAKGLTVKKGG